MIYPALHFAIYHISGVLVARVKVCAYPDIISARDALHRAYPKCQPYLYNPAIEAGEFINASLLSKITAPARRAIRAIAPN